MKSQSQLTCIQWFGEIKSGIKYNPTDEWALFNEFLRNRAASSCRVCAYLINFQKSLWKKFSLGVASRMGWNLTIMEWIEISPNSTFKSE